MLTRRRFAHLGAMAAGSVGLGSVGLGLLRGQSSAAAGVAGGGGQAADFTLEIAPYVVEPSPKHKYRTLAYNGQVPGPLLRMKRGRPVTVDVHNRSNEADIVHWHGLFLPVAVDGAMEEGSPMIPAGASTRLEFTPDPAGFRWFHTHTFAGNDLRKAQYGGEHGFLLIEPHENPARYDREVFLALHDWGGYEMSSGDGSAMPQYDVTTINGKMLGFGDPVQVKQGERVMMHILNSSPTEVHWVALSGHRFRVVALDGNDVPTPGTVEMLRLAPAERVSAMVEMNAPGAWVLGEAREEVRKKGMGIVVEYAGSTGQPKWVEPGELAWDYARFAERGESAQNAPRPAAGEVVEIPLRFKAKFQGHASEEKWLINGKPYPEAESPKLIEGKRYRLVMKDDSQDEHPIHLHRHTFEVVEVGGRAMRGLMKDVVLVPVKGTSTVEFVANNPGNTLFHCHQQDHMDRGFMMVFQYA